jgi:Mg-chelatase subunit ChlD
MLFNKYTLTILLPVYWLLLTGCTITNDQKQAELPGPGLNDIDTDTDSAEAGSTDSDTFDNTADTASDINFDMCAEERVDLSLLPVAMMILQDVSGSMNSPDRWGVVWPVITDMLKRYKDSNLRFGFDIFPDFNACGVDRPVFMDCTQDKTQSQSIIDSIADDFVPVGGTPLYEAMAKFLDNSYAAGFLSDGRKKVLLVVSDGEDTCGKKDGYYATVADFTIVTEKLLEKGILTLTIGFGDGFDVSELNAIAAAGGTEITEYISADDAESLEEAFRKVSGEVVRCEFTVPEPVGKNLEDGVINFFAGDTVIPHHDKCVRGEGWTWFGDVKDRTVRFCYDSCDYVTEKNRPVSVLWGCDTVELDIF